MRPRTAGVGVLVATLTTSLTQDLVAQAEMPVVLTRVGAYVERYYSRAQRLVATEAVEVQMLAHDLAASGFPERYVNEVRVDWGPREEGKPAVATFVRRLITMNGRRPKSKDQRKCLAPPETDEIEPLSSLLPDLQAELKFSWSGLRRVDERPVVVIDFQEITPPKVSSEWTKDCMSAQVDGRGAGRLWADPDTGEVLRLDTRLKGMVDIPVPREHQGEWQGSVKTLDRSDLSVRYRPVTFTDPDETLLLPATIERMVHWRGAGGSRYRRTQRFSNYKRFVAEGRVVMADGADSDVDAVPTLSEPPGKRTDAPPGMLTR